MNQLYPEKEMKPARDKGNSYETGLLEWGDEAFVRRENNIIDNWTRTIVRLGGDHIVCNIQVEHSTEASHAKYTEDERSYITESLTHSLTKANQEGRVTPSPIPLYATHVKKYKLSYHGKASIFEVKSEEKTFERSTENMEPNSWVINTLANQGQSPYQKNPREE